MLQLVEVPGASPWARLTSGLSRAVAGAITSAVVLLLPSVAMAEVDLMGTWYVLIHFKDTATANPDADRWEDKVWKFQKKGSRLQWTEYPIVVFEDKQGRFGRVGRNERARLLNAWEPNEGQRAEIAAGLQVNSRGSKTKALRGSPKRGYKSTSRSRSTSAFTVGYEEAWSISTPLKVPAFTRDDSLGTEASLAAGEDGVVSGRTRYKGLEVEEDGNLIVGTYTRDESKKGTFRLIRAGDSRGVESDGRTPNEKAAERAREQIQAGIRNEAYSQFQQDVGEEDLRALRAVIGEDGITEIWQKYERRLIGGDESARAEIGNDLRAAYSEGLRKKLEKSFAEGDPNALLGGEMAGLDSDSAQLMRTVRETLGEEKIAELREKYRDRIAAGDEKAKAQLEQEIREAFVAKARVDF